MVQDLTQDWRDGLMKKIRGAMTRDQKIQTWIQMLRDRMFTDIMVLDHWQVREGVQEAMGQYRWLDKTWRKLEPDGVWGGDDVTAFLRTSIKLPASYAGKPVIADLMVGGDGLLSVNGKPFHGLDPFHTEVLLEPRGKAGAKYDLEIEAYAKHMVDPDDKHKIRRAQIASVDREIETFYWDVRLAFEVGNTDTVEPDFRDFIFTRIEKALYALDPYEVDEKVFKKQMRASSVILHKELYQNETFKHPGKLGAVGHSHLDVVFLWPYKEYLRKIGRTHATQLRLLEEFPEAKFSQSQAATYYEMKKWFPTMFREVKQMARKGRWEVIGAMFVEPDCNLIAGESFVRQILFGTQFYQKEFGVRPRTCWLPDNFGMPHTLPQILKRSGIEYFMTHKFTLWNDTNEWKTHVFWWESPDGSRIFSHVPSTHFIGSCEPRHILLHWDKFQQKEESGRSMYAYGWGDGGGGPDRQMLQSIRRLRKFPGMPKLETMNAEDFLDELYTNTKKDRIPVWNDELYLETHRGTFTTKGRLKKYNRRAEFLFRRNELFGSVARELGKKYPKAVMDEAWQRMLVLQFHDTLPGSHIATVYKETVKEYEEIFSLAGGVAVEALSAVATKMNTKGKGQPLVIFNPQPFVRTEPVYLTLKSAAKGFVVVDADGNACPTQITERKGGEVTLVFVADSVPSCGAKVFFLTEGKAAGAGGPSVSAVSMENELLKVKINANGEITSLHDKANDREIIPPGAKGNELQLFEDQPGRYDAWDIVSTYKNRRFDLQPATSVKVVESGPVRAAVEVRRKLSESDVVQKIVMYRGIGRVDFETWVDWKEEHKLLKAAFPVSVHSRHATYDIAFGNIQRPTHATNSFDQAKFEVPLHKWMDLSEANYGVAMLNDCKYGGDVHDNVLRLTLLRAPKHPDPTSDMEEHTFTYSLYPHAESWSGGGVGQAALAFNDPMLALPAKAHEGSLGREMSFIEVEGEGVTLETFKPAEDGQGYIVRLVEQGGARRPVSVRLWKKIAKAAETDLIERDFAATRVSKGVLNFEIEPYQIRSFRLFL